MWGAWLSQECIGCGGGLVLAEGVLDVVRGGLSLPWACWMWAMPVLAEGVLDVEGLS